MRISDWSSDVCSSDLTAGGRGGRPAARSDGGTGRTGCKLHACGAAGQRSARNKRRSGGGACSELRAAGDDPIGDPGAENSEPEQVQRTEQIGKGTMRESVCTYVLI